MQFFWQKVLLSASILFGALAFVSNANASGVDVSFPSSAPGRSGDVMLTGDLYIPSGNGPKPAVVLMHGCGGWQPSVMSALDQHAEFLKQQGFVVLNLDSFGPRDLTGGTVCESLNRLSSARTYRSYDAFDALRFLQAQSFVDSDNVFLMGQSNGGSVALNAASRRGPSRYGQNHPFRAVVAFYPWCGTYGTTRFSLSSPLLILGGGQDDWVPPADCQRFRATGADLEVKVYENAAHSFDIRIPVQRYQGNLVGYNPSAAADSRQQMLAFFRNHMS